MASVISDRLIATVNRCVIFLHIQTHHKDVSFEVVVQPTTLLTDNN